jgi:hypothetical protein
VKFSEFKEKAEITFSVDSGKYVVAKLKKVPKFSEKVFSIIRDKNEVTVVAKKGFLVKAGSEQKFFKLITFDVELPFDLTGFLSHVSTLLASENIGLLAFSAYSTDHLLVKEQDLDRAVAILKKDGMTCRNRDQDI